MNLHNTVETVDGQDCVTHVSVAQKINFFPEEFYEWLDVLTVFNGVRFQFQPRENNGPIFFHLFQHLIYRQRRVQGPNLKNTSSGSSFSVQAEFGDFRLFFRGQLRNVQSFKTHVFRAVTVVVF